MSLSDYYLICEPCNERVYVCSRNIGGHHSEDITDFVVKHNNHSPLTITDSDDLDDIPEFQKTADK